LPLKSEIIVVIVSGQSKRIWAELYKVLDSSDVVVQVYYQILLFLLLLFLCDFDFDL
jgi:hypothetical protein